MQNPRIECFVDSKILSPTGSKRQVLAEIAKSKFVKQMSRNLLELDRKDRATSELKPSLKQQLPSLTSVNKTDRSLSPSSRRYESLDSSDSSPSLEHQVSSFPPVDRPQFIVDSISDFDRPAKELVVQK